MTPQYIVVNEVGSKFYYKDKEMTILHREDGPAIEWRIGSKEWWIDGARHREDGPATEWQGGGKEWWIDGVRHREDGPAIVDKIVKCKEWFVDGVRHREDGPAVERESGYNSWYLNGRGMTEEEYLKRTAPEIVMSMDEIAAKLGIDVNKLKIVK